MDKESFQFSLDKVTPLVQKEDTLLRQSVLPVECLFGTSARAVPTAACPH